jgi:hypothetical protein
MAGGESYGGITVPDGDPGGLEASAGRLRATAGMLQAVAGRLTGVLGSLDWFGPGSTAHASLTTTQNLMASNGADTLMGQATVINGYAHVLEAAQRAAKRAIEHARDADRRIREAKDDIQQAIDDQIDARTRIALAQEAQVGALGDQATRVVAAAEEAAAWRDLAAAEDRERKARHRLEVAEEDRRQAQKDGLEAMRSVADARVALVGAAQGAGLLPTQPGGPADPAFAAAAGIVLPPPPKPPEHKSWFERRLDDVGNAATWTWDQTKQVPGGVWEGTKGMYEGVKFATELNPTAPDNLIHLGRTIDRYQQLAGAGKFAYDHPDEFGKQLVNWEDLSHGRYGEWAGNLVPDIALAVATGGAGTAASRASKVAGATEKLTTAERAFARAGEIKSTMPTKDLRARTFAAQAGDDGRIAISGENTAAQRKALERIGVDPDLLMPQSSEQMRAALAGAGHEMPPHGLDKLNHQPPGWYHGTHAELKVVVHDPKSPVGVTLKPCAESCNPGLSKLAVHEHQDIVVHSDHGPTLYRQDGAIIEHPTPSDFTGVNSRWPGMLWGGGGGAFGLSTNPAGP